jgi:multiple sugar transport system substrate-binding protein
MAAAVAAAATAALLAGCGGAGDPAEAALRVQVAGEPDEVNAFEAIAAAYEQAEPGARVDVVAVPKKSDHLARLSTAFAAGDPPDVFVVNYREFAQFAARGALEPVGPLLDQRGVRLDDYFPEPVTAFTYDGALQCMPQNVSSLVVYLNLAAFAERGVPLPQPGWTLADLATTAAALSGDGDFGVGFEPTLARLAPFVWTLGGEVVDDQEAPTALTVGSPAGVQAVEYLRGLVASGSAPGEVAVAAQGLEERFAAGSLAMLLSSRRETPGFREVAGLDFDVAAFPVAAEPATLLHSDAFCIARGGDQVAAAADFVAFATGTQGQTLAALAGRSVPALTSVAESPAFLSPGRPPASSQVFLDAIPAIRAFPSWPTWTEVEDLAEVSLQQVIWQGAPAAAALAALDAASRPVLERGAG